MNFSVSFKHVNLFDGSWIESARFTLRSEAEQYLKAKRFNAWRKNLHTEWRIDTL